MTPPLSEWGGTVDVSSGGTGPGDSRPLPFMLYQTGLLLLGLALLVVASENTIGEGLRRALPVLYAVLLAWCVFQVGLFSFSLRARQSELLWRLRLTVDLTFTLGVVWLTGGVVSFFLPILFASVLASSTVLGFTRALFLAGGSTLALTVMTVSQILGWRPSEWSGAVQLGVDGRVGFLLSCLVGQAIALHAIAYLGARLTRGLRRAERLNDLIVKTMDDGVLALDCRGRLILMNDECLQLLGYPTDTRWQGRAPMQVFKRAGDQALLEVLTRSDDGPQCLDWRDRSGSAVPLSVRTREVVGRGRDERVRIFVFHDTTLEQRAANSEGRLRTLEALEDLALGLVHEIRNPLASIRGCVQELGTGRLSRDQSAKLSRIVVRESDRLDRIVDEFLEYSNSNPTRSERVFLLPIVKEIVESLERREDAHGFEFRVDGEADVYAVADRELLYRVILNLGINALEASSGEGAQGKWISFAVSASDDGCVIEVRDRGCGVDPATRQRIFHPFFSTKAREGGLGLALVERIIHGHRGTVEVESAPGDGACFRIWLPVDFSDDVAAGVGGIRGAQDETTEHADSPVAASERGSHAMERQ